jgi:hypothetical protein
VSQASGLKEADGVACEVELPPPQTIEGGSWEGVVVVVPTLAEAERAVEALTGKGVTFEHYDNLTDERGIARGLALGRGQDIAWFKDPAGNILSVLQQA